MEELALCARAIEAAQHAVANRDEPYEREMGTHLLTLGLKLGLSAVRSCELLGPTQPFWCCVCARPFLEFALRLLWASRQEDGMGRMFSYYADEHREWLRKLSNENEEHLPAFAETETRVPLSQLPAPMPKSMADVIKDIGNKDQINGVASMCHHKDHYRVTIGFLHNFLHANPVFVNDDPLSFLAYAAQGVLEGTVSLLRAVGYRLNWDQNEIVTAIYGISSGASLTSEEKAALRAAVERGEVDGS